MDLKRLLGFNTTEKDPDDGAPKKYFGLSGDDGNDAFHLAAEAAANVSSPTDATLDPAAPENAQHMAASGSFPNLLGASAPSVTAGKERGESGADDDDDRDDLSYFELDEGEMI